jgi:hypothetical protein
LLTNWRCVNADNFVLKLSNISTVSLREVVSFRVVLVFLRKVAPTPTSCNAVTARSQVVAKLDVDDCGFETLRVEPQTPPQSSSRVLKSFLPVKKTSIPLNLSSPILALSTIISSTSLSYRRPKSFLVRLSEDEVKSNLANEQPDRFTLNAKSWSWHVKTFRAQLGEPRKLYVDTAKQDFLLVPTPSLPLCDCVDGGSHLATLIRVWRRARSLACEKSRGG